MSTLIPTMTTTQEAESDTKEVNSNAKSILDFENEYEQSMILFVMYIIGLLIFIIFNVLSIKYFSERTWICDDLENDKEKQGCPDPLALCSLTKLLWQTEKKIVLSTIFEILDIVTDVWFAITLVESNNDNNNNNNDNNDNNNYELMFMGILSSISGLFGVLFLIIKIAGATKFYGGTNATKNNNKLKINLKINGEIIEYDKRMAMKHILMWDILSSGFADIPQILIGLTYMIVWNDIMPSALVCVLASLFLIFWKMVALCCNINSGLEIKKVENGDNSDNTDNQAINNDNINNGMPDMDDETVKLRATQQETQLTTISED